MRRASTEDSKPAGGHARHQPEQLVDYLRGAGELTPARWTAAEVTQGARPLIAGSHAGGQLGNSSRASAHSSPSATAHLQRLAELGNPRRIRVLAVPSGMPSRSAVSWAVRP